MAGDKATKVLDQLIDNYLAEAPQLLQAMRAAVATKDAAALLQATQTLRSAPMWVPLCASYVRLGSHG